MGSRRCSDQVFMNAPIKLFTLTILVCFIYVWSHVEDFVALLCVDLAVLSPKNPNEVQKESRIRLGEGDSYQIRKIVGCACAGNAEKRFPRHQLEWKPLVNDPCMHHGTCATHVPWCMSGSVTRGGGENVPGIPGACATCNFTYLARGS